MNKSTTILILCLITLFACKKESKEEREAHDDKLTLQRANYTGNELRIDGYYYSVWSGGFYHMRVFYRNGTVKQTGSPSGSNISDADNYISTISTEIMTKKYGWGVFIINGSSIKLEEWMAGSNKLAAYTREGTILNDTTFKFTQVYRLVSGVKTGVSALDETFYFRQYSPKPDSTNQYIP
ncbi:MAG: hypothetical protein KDB74_06160 [Flavobacteriales bacterium]|nr:hypothetical protein [Flavobacteriales bacterium]MCB9174696.1 hypothetical protein [Flavobacteriales bacterium]